MNKNKDYNFNIIVSLPKLKNNKYDILIDKYLYDWVSAPYVIRCEKIIPVYIRKTNNYETIGFITDINLDAQIAVVNITNKDLYSILLRENYNLYDLQVDIIFEDCRFNTFYFEFEKEQILYEKDEEGHIVQTLLPLYGPFEPNNHEFFYDIFSFKKGLDEYIVNKNEANKYHIPIIFKEGKNNTKKNIGYAIDIDFNDYYILVSAIIFEKYKFLIKPTARLVPCVNGTNIIIGNNLTKVDISKVISLIFNYNDIKIKEDK